MKRTHFPDALTKKQRRDGYVVAPPSFVYFIANADNSRVKIGTSYKLATRLNQLKADFPGMRYLGHTPGGVFFERKIHRKFAADRLEGEWFTLTDALREFMEDVGLSKQRPLFYTLFSELARQPFCDAFEADENDSLVSSTQLPLIGKATLKNIGEKRGFMARVPQTTETVEVKRRPKTKDLEDSMYLERKEIEELFRVIKSKRDRAIFRLAYHRGLRAHEVGIIQLSDFRDRDGILYIRRGKGSICREHVLTDSELRPLRFYLKERGSAPGPLFPSRQGRKGISRYRLDQLMKEYCKLAGIPRAKAHMHALKHSCGTQLRELGAAADEIQDWLGHRDSGSTDVYMHFTKLRRAELADRFKDWK